MAQNIEMQYLNSSGSYEKIVPYITASDNSCFLSSETAGLFGLGEDAVPDDVLGTLSKATRAKIDQEPFTVSGKDWTFINTIGQNSPAKIAYGNGVYVCVFAGVGNKACYSEDGRNWTQVSLPVSNNWEAITFGDGKFIILGYENTNGAYSEDGRNWTAFTGAVNQIWAVAYGAGKFVAVGYRVGEYSLDGINWTTMTVPATSLTAIAYGNGTFVVTVANWNPGIIYSTDGVTWESSDLAFGFSSNALAFGAGKFVAILPDTKDAYYSTNGINWTKTNLPISATWNGLAYGDNKFVCVPRDSKIDTAIYSEDGVSWSKGSIPEGLYSGITYGNSGFVAVTQEQSGAISKTVYGYTLFDTTGNDIKLHADIILGGEKIATGSYVGTGTYGGANRNSFTFDFEPKLFGIVYKSLNENRQYPIPNLWTKEMMKYSVKNATNVQCFHSASVGASTTFEAAPLRFLQADKTISFYGSNANYHLNARGYTYYYFAIG